MLAALGVNRLESVYNRIGIGLDHVGVRSHNGFSTLIRLTLIVSDRARLSVFASNTYRRRFVLSIGAKSTSASRGEEWAEFLHYPSD